MEKKKKNDQPYIIPPSYFRSKGIEGIKIPAHVKQNAEAKAQENNVTQKIEEKTISSSNDVTGIKEPIVQENSIPNIVDDKQATPVAIEKKSPLLSRERKTSGLSLSSIKRKKEHEESKEEKVVDPQNLPSEAFTESQMQALWIEYGKIQDKKGERIIGSMFAMNIPTLNENTILLELPNQSMKVDLEAAQSGLLQFLYKKLQNYSIALKITVNEEASKKYAFTPQDKYDKLREKNPLIDKLRSSFDLDI